MPKDKVKQREFNSRMIREYPKVFRADDNILFCLMCENKAPAKKLFSVKQHLDSVKHKLAEARKSKNAAATSQTLMTSFQTPQSQVNIFHQDMCKAFMEANIPLHKTSHPSVVKFLEKYTNRAVPSESTLRNKYVSTLYDQNMNRLRAKVADKCIWITLDETTDSEQRLVGNFMFGLMEGVDQESNERGKCYLLNVAVLRSSDASSISAFFMDSLILLWPEGT